MQSFITQPRAYAKFRPHYPAELFAELSALCAEKNSVWDVGTGSGQAAVDLAAHFQQVFASDLDFSQLQQAEARANINYLQCKAEQAPFKNASMDLIAVAQALHWFDFEKFFSEVNRVLKPEGIFAAWTYSRCRLAPHLDEILADFYHRTIGPYWPAQRHWVDEAYAGIEIPLEFIAIPDKMLQKNWSLEHFLGYVSSWSAVTHYQKATGENPLPLLAQQLALLWGNAEQPIQWTLTIKAGRKCNG